MGKLDGPIPNDGDTIHLTALWPIVVGSVMLNDPIVPKGNTIRLPFEAALVFRHAGF